MTEQISEIKQVLEEFQHGYKIRDMSQLSPFLKELFVTDSVGPGKIRELVEN